MSDWKGKSRGNTLGYRYFVTLIKYFGLYPAYIFLFFVAAYFYLFVTKEPKHWLRIYFKERIGFSSLKTEFSIYKNFILLGHVLIDKIAILAGYSKKYTTKSNGAENLRNLVALDKGGILLGAHLGNWEVAGHFLSNYSGKINVLMFDGEDENIKAYMESVIGGKRFNIINIKNDLSHVYAVSDALERKEIICIHADRFLPGNKTVVVPFLGKEAQFPIGAFQLIKTFRANYTFVYGIKTGFTHYDFFARPHRTASADSKIEDMVADYASDLESMVIKNPEQWFNYYDFWKTK